MALAEAVEPEIKSRGEILLGIPHPLNSIAAELQDTRCWQWVADNTAELSHDTYAAAEVARQVAASRQALLRRVAGLFGFRRTNGDVEWWRNGRQLQVPASGGLSAALSLICDELFCEAPHIRNELLNRRSLSSAATAARQRLIERIFSTSDQQGLGLPADKAPPEKSMYLSVLSAGNLHRRSDERYELGEPPKESDPLKLRPTLERVLALLDEGEGHRVPVPGIVQALQTRPYGVRAGVTPLLLAVVAVSHAHELAVYENGTFLPTFGAPDFLRMIEQPVTFELQLCRIAGVRAQVFAQLAHVFAAERPADRQPELLDVVRPLSTFAAGLSEYTRRTSEVPKIAGSVHDVLLEAREPASMLFRDLPLACDVEPFLADSRADPKLAQLYIARLRTAMDEPVLPIRSCWTESVLAWSMAWWMGRCRRSTRKSLSERYTSRSLPASRGSRRTPARLLTRGCPRTGG